MMRATKENLRPKNNNDGMGSKKKSFHQQMADHEADHNVGSFMAMTRWVVYGLQHRDVQGMLVFNFMCTREKPSLAVMIFPFFANSLAWPDVATSLSSLCHVETLYDVIAFSCCLLSSLFTIAVSRVGLCHENW
jgi:hypothetical protein